MKIGVDLHKKLPKIRSIKFNVIMNMILTSSQMLFPLISLPYVSRVLSTYGTGAVAFAQSVLTYFSLVALLGIQTYGVKACASVRDDIRQLSQTVKEILLILLISTSIVFVFYLCSIFLIPRFRENRDLFLFFSIGLWLASFGAEWFFQAIEQYGYITFRNIVFKLIGLVMMFMFVRRSSDYITYGVIILFTGYGMNVLNILRLRRLVDFSLTTRVHLLHHLKSMFWYMIASISSGMYIQTDIVVLGFMGSTNIVGLYQLAAKIKNVLIQIVNSVGNVMLPRLSFYRAKMDTDKIAHLMAKNFNFISLISGLLIGCTITCSNSIVWIMGGSDFQGSAVPLILAVPAVFFSSINILIGNELITESREREWAVVNFITLILSFIFAIVLISLFGIVGAAMTSALTELSSLIMRCWRGRDFLRTILPQVDFGKILLSFILSLSITIFTKIFTSLQAGFLALVLYGGCFTIFYVLALIIVRESFCSDMFSQLLVHIRK